MLDVLLCTSCRQTTEVSQIPKFRNALDAPPQLRVEIAGNASSVDLRVHGPYRLQLGEGAATTLDGEELTLTTVRPTPTGLSVGRESHAVDRLSLVPMAGHPVGVASRRYRGTITIQRKSPKALTVVNVIDAETMLKGVVGAEMPARWPIEALAAQAVTARTFVLYRKIERHGKPVHVSSKDVRYLGVESETSRTRSAVDQTRGTVLVYGWRMFPAYFHSTCGGRTTSAKQVFGEREIPPLAGCDCGHCTKATFYSWSCKLDAQEVAKRLGMTAGEKIRHIAPDAAQFGQHATQVVVKTSQGERSFDPYGFRTALGPDKLKSMAFTVTDTGQTFEFRGRGWGHGVGLCQWGARGLARAHYDWPSIVTHYFPQASLVRVY